MTGRGGQVDVAGLLRQATFPPTFPFGPEAFSRMDESNDTEFYLQPRFVFHIDEFAVKALTNYYAGVLPQHGDVLDICSSWVSHFPEGFKGRRVVGLGMNKKELEKNNQLTEYVVQDLNVNTKLPFEDASFDFACCVVSVDYLNKPLEVFRELARVLRPGGSAHMSFSNRCFPSKAIKIWLETTDADHVLIVGSYFHYAGGFEKAEAVDLSPNPGITDPMFVVRATRKAGPAGQAAPGAAGVSIRAGPAAKEAVPDPSEEAAAAAGDDVRPPPPATGESLGLPPAQ